MLDTNICINLLAQTIPTLTQKVANCEAGSLGVSSIVFAEIALGSTLGKAPPPELLDAFISEVPLLPFDEAAARAYAALPFRRGSFDRLIAAHALALGLTLVTGNSRDFSAIQGLRIEDWTVA